MLLMEEQIEDRKEIQEDQMLDDIEIQEDQMLDDIKINFINIYAGENTRKAINKYNLYFLKKIKNENIVIDIKKEIKYAINKKQISYNSTYEDDEIIVMEASEIKVWNEIKNKIQNREYQTILEFKGRQFSIMIYDVHTNLGNYYLLFKNKSNNFLKKRNYLATILDNTMNIIDKNTDTIALEISPSSIIKDKIIYILKLKSTEEILNLDEFYNEELKKVEMDLMEILSCDLRTIKSKKDKNHLLYGINNGTIKNFKNLSLEKKNIVLNKLKIGYSEKTGKCLNIDFIDGKLNIENLKAEEKTCIIMLISGKSAIKIVQETLTTPVD